MNDLLLVVPTPESNRDNALSERIRGDLCGLTPDREEGEWLACVDLGPAGEPEDAAQCWATLFRRLGDLGGVEIERPEGHDRCAGHFVFSSPEGAEITAGAVCARLEVR